MTHLWPEGELIGVVSDAWGAPRSFTWRGQTHRVRRISKRWRVDVDWWQDRVWREYFKLATYTGLLVVIYRDIFGPERFWIEIQHHLLSDDDALVYDLVELARGLRLGYVATNNVHYAVRNERQLQDVLVCIRHQTRLEESGDLLRPGSEFYLKPAWRMAPLFRHYPEAITNTRRVAERCQFELRYGLQDLPRFPTPPGLKAITFLESMCREAIPGRYPDSPQRVWDQLAHELAVIEQAGLANYFLIVWDIVRFAREQGIRCQGRGSAANSFQSRSLYSQSGWKQNAGVAIILTQ